MHALRICGKSHAFWQSDKPLVLDSDPALQLSPTIVLSVQWCMMHVFQFFTYRIVMCMQEGAVSQSRLFYAKILLDAMYDLRD